MIFMTTSRLRAELGLRPAQTEYAYITHSFYRDQHNFQKISLTHTTRSTPTQLLRLFILDYCDGNVSGYQNPYLVTHLHPFQADEPLRTIRDTNPQRFLMKLRQLSKRISGEDCVMHFGIGENWDKDPDTLVRLISPEESFISVTDKTKTEHLTPFIDAKVEDGTLVVYEDGREVVREILRPPKVE